MIMACRWYSRMAEEVIRGSKDFGWATHGWLDLDALKDDTSRLTYGWSGSAHCWFGLTQLAGVPGGLGRRLGRRLACLDCLVLAWRVLGARLVGVGRPSCWLAGAGQAQGVTNVRLARIKSARRLALALPDWAAGRLGWLRVVLPLWGWSDLVRSGLDLVWGREFWWKKKSGEKKRRGKRER